MTFAAAALSADYETVATFHHEAIKAFRAAVEDRGYDWADADAIYSEEAARIKTAGGWDAYKRTPRAGSAYPISRAVRAAAFDLYTMGAALHRVTRPADGVDACAVYR